MAIPVGITTAFVHMDAPVSFIGDPGRLHVTISSSVPLVWAATGTPLANFVDSINPGDGVALEVDLPHTDQNGFVDGNGNAFKGWSYIVTSKYEKSGQLVHFPDREFQILSGQADVDLALVPSGGSYVPVVAPILPVTSLNGRTGAVVLVKADVGLDRADNTNDLEKPVSTATQAALNTVTANANSRILQPADPNADRILFWDDSAGMYVPLVHSAPLAIAGTTLSVNAATGSLPGTMSAADKAKLDAATVSEVANTLVLRDAQGNTFFGSVVLSDAPAGASYATRKDYVDNIIDTHLHDYTDFNAIPELGATEDLNLFVTSGEWHQSSSAEAGTGLNYPVGIAGLLKVRASGSMVYQWYSAYNTGTIYYRTKYTTTWYPWKSAAEYVAADKTKLDAATAAATNSTIVMRDLNGNSVFGSVILEDAPSAVSHATRKDYVDAQTALKEPTLAAGTTAQYYRGDKTWQALDKAAVGLSLVTNTSDAGKPVSTAQAAADALLAKGRIWLTRGTTNTGSFSGLTVVSNLATFTFKANRKYRIVWDTDWLPSANNVMTAFWIATCAVGDTAASTAGLTNIAVRDAAGVVANISSPALVTAYYEPTVDTTTQIKFLAQVDGTAGTMIVQGNRAGGTVYAIFDDGMQY